MAALSKDTQRALTGGKTLSFPIKNASQIYVGSFCSLLAGYVQPFAGAALEMLVGRALPSPNSQLTTQLLGNTSPGAGIQVPEATISTEDEVLIGVSVTGVTAQTDVGAKVYLNSTDNDLTKTRPARGIPFGIITRWVTSTTCNVLRFGFATSCALALSGSADSVLVAYLQFGDVSSADFQIATPPYGGSIRSLSATVNKAWTTGASGSFTINAKIGSTLVTGGVVTINTTGGSGGAAADVCAGTAITAANVFSESSTLKLTLTLTSTFTAGSAMVFATFDHSLGL